MEIPTIQTGATVLRLASLVFLGVSLTGARSAAADEGGVSFWLPGQFSSFASVPSDPGWTLSLTTSMLRRMRGPKGCFAWAAG